VITAPADSFEVMLFKLRTADAPLILLIHVIF
jgi:hypothetical protein